MDAGGWCFCFDGIALLTFLYDYTEDMDDLPFCTQDPCDLSRT